MDIWQWVHDLTPELRKAGQHRLADLIRRLPSETVDDHHDRVDALAPEALALARAASLPWVEVFVRHWHLQSRVLHRSQGDMALGEAVALVDFAHSEPARGCPQAVCTVQDLAACYAQVDGPGYAPERASVSRETLARIDPTWPCFTCISTEHAAALREQGDPQAALDFLDAQQRALAAAGLASDRYSLLPERIWILIDLGRHEEALTAVRDALANGRRDESQRRSRQIDLARILARLGQFDEARRELPPVHEILPTPSHYEAFTDALSRLVDAGAAPNDPALGRLLQRFIARLLTQGAYRLPLVIAETAARLACQRGAPAVARLHLAAMERLLARLHRPCGAPERVERTRRLIDAAVPRDLPEQPSDPEDIFLRLAAADAAPDDLEHARRRAQALVELGFGHEAAGALEAFVAAHPDDEAAIYGLAAAYDQAGLEDRHRALTDRLLESTDPRRSTAGHWLAARQLARDREWAASNAHLDVVVAHNPRAISARLFHAANARALSDWPTVLRRLDEVVALGHEPGPHDWDRMVAATITGAWDRVRESAARLGMQLAGDGPIDESWELCRIRVEHPSGKRQELYAARTGPVTARLLQISRVDQPQRLFDHVVFDARPLNDPKPDDPDERPVFDYPEVTTLARADYQAFSLDGVHPGKDALAAARQAVEALRGVFQVQSGDRYRVTGPDGDEHPGIFVFIAFPPQADLAAASAALSHATADLPHPLVWPSLAEAAGDTALAETHRALADAWSLV